MNIENHSEVISYFFDAYNINKKELLNVLKNKVTIDGNYLFSLMMYSAEFYRDARKESSFNSYTDRDILEKSALFTIGKAIGQGIIKKKGSKE